MKLTPEDLALIESLRSYAAHLEREAEEKVPLSPNFSEDVMARIRREEARGEAREESRESALGWLVFLQSRTALAISAALVVLALVVLIPLGSSSAQFAMALPQGIKGEPPKAPDFYLDPAPKLSVDWKRLTFSIPLRAGGELSGTLAPISGATGGPAREFDLKAAGTSNGESVSATGRLVVMPNKPDETPPVLRVQDVYWLKLNLTLRGSAREEQIYRVFGSP
ncbi:MAG: hypothetical protein JNN07_26975 [Verrucomicrobiales bacterium]|nr:hypothetical protein [Verrucomicrobiales bacterium]